VRSPLLKQGTSTQTQEAPGECLAGLCVLSIDYRLAPEHLFPAAFEDASAALKWIQQHGPPEDGGGTSAKKLAKDVFVCGDSAGGGLALAACLSQPEAVRRNIRGVMGLSAWADLTASTPSYESRQWCADTLSGDAVNAGVDRISGKEEAEGYLGRGGVELHGRDWRASPFFASPKRLRSLPSVLLQVGDFELILDESVLLQQRLRKLGEWLCGTAGINTRREVVWNSRCSKLAKPFATSQAGLVLANLDIVQQ